jgi:hypothetical protein
MNKTIYAVLGIIVGIAIIGAYMFPKQLRPVNTTTILQGVSSAGTTFGNAKFAGVTVRLGTAGAGATSTSILNTDTSDRFVTGFRLACNGVGTSKTAYTGTGLASLQLTIATTSEANVPTITTKYVFPVTSAVPVSTSTVNAVIASSTFMGVGATATSSNSVVWNSGSYMTFFWNATNTAACTEGVDYIGS